MEEEAERDDDKIKTDESEDEVEMTPKTKARMMHRVSKRGVSAEVYGKNNPQGEFTPRVRPG